jgi:hypothetical protein
VNSLLDAVFEDTPMQVPEDVRRFLFDASAGHPNFTAALGRRALEAANDGRRNIICVNDVELAVAEIATTRSEMFATSWFAPEILSKREREVAIDLAFTANEHRAWMDLRDVTARIGEGGRDILNRLTYMYVLEGSSGGNRAVRICGGVLESFLRTQHGVTLAASPDVSQVSVGIFLDVENLIRGVRSPEELVNSVERFAARFGEVHVRVTAATAGALTRAGWALQHVEAALAAVNWQFRQPPKGLAGKQSIADNVLSPIISQSAEQFNLAEIVLGSGDYSFIPVAQAIVGDSSDDDLLVTGRRVHALSRAKGTDAEGGGTPRNREWHTLADRRFHVCNVRAEDRPDLVLWDLEDIVDDPENATPITPLVWPPE